MSGPLHGRVALVTGASGGIGRAIAWSLAEAGAAVALVARREVELLALQAELQRAGRAACVAPADLSDPSVLPGLLEQIQRELGPIDILVNNAGVVRRGPMHAARLDHWDLSMTLNLKVPFLLSQAVLPGMRARRRGWIVNISSEAALDVVPGMGPYSVSKVALNRLTEQIVVENQELSVRALAVCPGWVLTDLSLPPTEIGLRPEEILRPEDVAGVVRWFVELPDRVQVGPVLMVKPGHPAAGLRASLEAFARRASSGAPP